MVFRKVLERLRPQKTRAETPTTTIYFAHAMAGLIGDDMTSVVRRIEPNVFLAGDTLLVVRHWSGPTREVLRSRPDLKVIYLIDDDIWTKESQAELPTAYRARVERLLRDFNAQIAGRVATVVAPSTKILERFGRSETRLIEPGLIYEIPDLDHHEEPALPFSIVFSGTSSHIADLASIADELAGFLAGRTDVHFTTFLGDRAPEALKLANCTHNRPMSWPEFRSRVAGLRFHAGIAPANATEFNASRSSTRLLDHAAFGAAGLYTVGSGPASAVTHDGDGLLVGAESGAWANALDRLATNREQCTVLARAGQKTARKIGDLDRLRDFWLNELCLKGQ
ncbi:MAG: hypothetical protein AAF441_10470 [Pseudomonadota bacterium]